MRSLFLTVVPLLTSLAVLPSLVAADEFCEDLWFTRNAIMNRAGYCFGSNLGRAIFDNTDCLGKNVRLNRGDQETVATLQSMEHDNDCRVDTSQSQLSLKDLKHRHALWFLPIRDLSESACIGWLGDQAGLRAGPTLDAPIIGKIAPGDTIGYSYLPHANWDYVQVFDSNWNFKSAGWSDLRITPKTCHQIAG
ncbi:DUF4453 domain-containing protein [Pseudophaeobacter sp.]|uniref:DUF4453 domain-containing protein n=1 Tax=Pseudophaeobacter sp. TaxID=1971739 RepID=UPI00329941AA